MEEILSIKRILLSCVLFLTLFISSTATTYAATGINQVVNFQSKVTNSDGTNVTDGTYDFVFQIYNGAGSGATSLFTESWTAASLFQTTTTAIGVTTSADGTVSFGSGLTNCSSLKKGQILTDITKGDSTVIIDPTNACTGSIIVAQTVSTWSIGDTITNKIYVKNGVFKVGINSLNQNFSGVDFNTDTLFLGINFNADGEAKPRIQMATAPYAMNANKVDGITFSGTSGNTYTLPSTNNGTILTSNASTQSIASTQTSGTVISFSDATAQTAAETGLSIALTGSGAFDQTGLTFNLANATGTNLNDIVGTGSNWKISKNGVLTVASCTGCSTNYWQLNNGAIAPFSTTADLMLGGSATTSAKFAFIGNASGQTPVASISAQTGAAPNGLALSLGSIQSLNNNTLTLGGNTTGNISIAPSNGLTVASLNNYANAFQVQNLASDPVFNINTTTPNLITNSDFETGITGWSCSGTCSTFSQTAVASQFYYGNAALQMNLGTGGSGAQTTAFNASTPNGTYTVSFWAKSASTVSGLAVALGSGTCTLNSATVSTSWAYYYCTVTITTAPTLKITATTTGVSIFIDAVQFVQTSTIQPYQGGQATLLGSLTVNSSAPLIQNANQPFAMQVNSFEDPTTTGGGGLLINGSSDNLNQNALVIGNGNGLVDLSVNTAADETLISGGNSGYNAPALNITSRNINSQALNVNGAAGSLTSTASISANSTFAALVINNSGSGDLITASSSGITRFRMTNNGSTVFQGDTLTSIGSVGNNSAAVSETNDLAVTNAIGDEGSLVPNSGFESAVTVNKTTNVASGPIADGWIATATMSAAVTRIATDSAKGSASVLMKLNASQSTSISSVCIPLSLKISAIYNLNFYANASTVSPVVRGFIDGFASKANCQSNTTPTSFIQGSVTASTVGWKIYGGATAMTTTGTNTWGRVRISVNCPASCTTGTTVEVDGIRLIETSNAVGVDYAEEYPADPHDIPQPGDVVSLEASGSASLVAKSHIPMDQALLGVVSTNPGEDLDDGSISGPKVPIALVGRVPVNVSTANGPIHVGDYVTSSNIPGVAVKAINAGSVIGTAMTNDTDPNTSDVTQVTLFIKNTYYNYIPSNNAGLLFTTPQNNALQFGNNGDTQQQASAAAQIQLVSSNASAAPIIETDGLSSTASIPISDTPIPTDFSTPTISPSVTSIANAVVSSITSFTEYFANVIFHKDVTFEGVATLNSDAGGTAIIQKGSDHVNITFIREYPQLPVVTISEIDTVNNGDYHYAINNRNTKGFTITLNKPADEDITFSWIALSIKDQQTTRSQTGTISPTSIITPYVTVSPIPNEITPIGTPSAAEVLP